MSRSSLVGRLALLVGMCGAVPSLAQEIGKELPTTPEPAPTSPPPTTYDNPYAPPPAAAPTPPPLEVKPGPAVPGPRKGAFGLRIGLSGSDIPAVPTAAGAVGGGAPTIGFKYLATDALALDVDVGLAVGFGSAVPFGFGVGLGVDFYLGSAEKPVRPFVTGGVRFGKNYSARGDDFALMWLNVGGGAEYWFSDHFAVNGRLLLRMGDLVFSSSSQLIQFATVSPALGTTFYF